MQKEKGEHKCPILNFKMNGKSYSWNEQYISKAQLVEITKVGDCEIHLAIEDPWEDETIKDDIPIDLARPGLEQFYTGTKRIKKIYITINHKSIPVERGKHSVRELKKLGSVPQDYELTQVIDGKFVPLNDDAILEIKGCEEFIGHILYSNPLV